MRALLLAAHGSRREASNQEVRAFAVELAGRLKGSFDRVECAFLELASPAIDEAVERLYAEGVTEVLVYPYFLAAGRHVASDIPEIIGELERRLPSLEITLAPYLGADPELPDLVARGLRGE